MYTLLSGIYSQLTTKDQYFLMILGLDNAGKTTLTEQIKQIYQKKSMNASQIGPTVGLNVAKVDVDDIKINIWDLGGQKVKFKLIY